LGDGNPNWPDYSWITRHSEAIDRTARAYRDVGAINGDNLAVPIWNHSTNFSSLVTDKTVGNFYSDSAPSAREFVVSLQACLLV
jgi:hypothetical protein